MLRSWTSAWWHYWYLHWDSHIVNNNPSDCWTLDCWTAGHVIGNFCPTSHFVSINITSAGTTPGGLHMNVSGAGDISQTVVLFMQNFWLTEVWLGFDWTNQCPSRLQPPAGAEMLQLEQLPRQICSNKTPPADTAIICFSSLFFSDDISIPGPLMDFITGNIRVIPSVVNWIPWLAVPWYFKKNVF